MSGESHPDLWVALLLFYGAMKEKYIEHYDYAELMTRIERVTKRRKQKIDIEKSALLVMDMQRFFIDSSSPAYVPSAEGIIENINNLIDDFRNHSRPVIFTRHINNESNAGMMNIYKYLLKDEDPMSQIDERMHRGDTVIEKSQFDAFHETGLEMMLKETCTNTIITAGVMTGRCIASTSRQAFVRGYNVILPADCTADFNRVVYESALISLSSSGICIGIMKEGEHEI